MSKFRMYVDETGTSDLKHADNPRHRFLNLTGVIIDLARVRSNVYPEMESLKSRYFDSHPDDPVIFHRKDMVNRRLPFQNLRDARVEREFNGELLRCLSEWEYAVVTVCLDKKNHAGSHGASNRDPYHLCMAILLERFERWLRSVGAKGDVMAEARGGKEDSRLRDEFRRIWTHGTDTTSRERLQSSLTSRNLKIKSKLSNVAGLQLADMIAHPSRNEILHENDLLGRPLGKFAEAIADALETKYARDEATAFGKSLI